MEDLVAEQVKAIEHALHVSSGGTSWNSYNRARSQANIALGRLAVWAEAGLKDSNQLPSGVTHAGTSPDGCTVKAQP